MTKNEYSEHMRIFEKLMYDEKLTSKDAQAELRNACYLLNSAYCAEYLTKEKQ